MNTEELKKMKGDIKEKLERSKRYREDMKEFAKKH